MDRFILTERRGEVGVITLNRPEILNAWHSPMRQQLVAAFTSFEEDETVRAIILTGAGDRAFSAGQDLNETRTFDGARGQEWVGEWERLYDAMRSLSKPLIAALNGVAAGSAFQVALLCDFRVAHPGVRNGAAGNQFRHRQHHRPVDDARDDRSFPHHRPDAQRSPDAVG